MLYALRFNKKTIPSCNDIRMRVCNMTSPIVPSIGFCFILTDAIPSDYRQRIRLFHMPTNYITNIGLLSRSVEHDDFVTFRWLDRRYTFSEYQLERALVHLSGTRQFGLVSRFIEHHDLHEKESTLDDAMICAIEENDTMMLQTLYDKCKCLWDKTTRAHYFYTAWTNDNCLDVLQWVQDTYKFTREEIDYDDLSSITPCSFISDFLAKASWLRSTFE